MPVCGPACWAMLPLPDLGHAAAGKLTGNFRTDFKNVRSKIPIPA